MRSYALPCLVVRTVRQDRRGLAARPVLRSARRLGVNLTTAAGVFLLAEANSFPVGCLAAALIGVGAGGEAAITPYLLTRYFGLRAFSTLYGLTWTFCAAAAAIRPVILGRAIDSTGSYTALLVMLATALGLAAGMNLLLPTYSNSSAIDL